jgi:hypothetical protein
MLHRSLRLPASVPQRPKSARAPARLGIDVGMTSWLFAISRRSDDHSLFLDAQTIMLASMNALTARVTPAKVVEVRARARARIALENARERCRWLFRGEDDLSGRVATLSAICDASRAKTRETDD